MRPKKIHRSNCDYNYTTTDETFELEEIIDVYGHIDNQQNGRTSQNLNGRVNTYSCVTDVKTQYETSGPKTNFSPAKNSTTTNTGSQDTQLATRPSRGDKILRFTTPGPVTTTESKKNHLEEKRKAQQKLLPKVEWQHEDDTVEVTHKTWHFKYVVTIMEAGGSQDKDVNTRITHTYWVCPVKMMYFTHIGIPFLNHNPMNSNSIHVTTRRGPLAKTSRIVVAESVFGG